MKLAKLYSILKELDAELQRLGVRGDYGWVDSPSFGLDALFAGVCLMASREDARLREKKALLRFAKRILDRIAEERDD